MSEAFKPILATLAEGKTLSEAETEAFFSACLRGEPSAAQVASALTAIRVRGETVGEIVACAKAMRKAVLPLDHPYEVIDVCGTGGDGLHTLNISTAVAFVVAGGGLKVAKHGNRAITSKSGTADVLAALGVNLEASLHQQRKALDDAGICFLFAIVHHGAMKHVSPIRQQLGFRTVFNLLGPLTNPAHAQRQVVGVATPNFVRPLCQALGQLGAKRAWVVHGSGLDELTTTGPTQICEWHEGVINSFEITPEALDLKRAVLSDILGGDPEYNASALRRLLDGETGPYRDIVLLNAAAAFVVGGLSETLLEGISRAESVIDSGAAKLALSKLIQSTNN
jgi:anthranilate phosphoribosyltransferase